VSGRVIVVGSINVDLVVVAPRLPHAGETVTGGTFARHHGGKGGNQAVAAARLGAPTSLIGCVGDDAFGLEARTALEAGGVTTDHLAVAPGQPTGVALIVVDGSGENLIAVASGANARLDASAVRAALAGPAAAGPGDVLLVGHEVPTAAARAALQLGRQLGVATIFNPAPADGLDRSTFGLADVLTPNRHELATLVGTEWHRLGRKGPPPSDPVAAATALIERNAEGPGPGAVLVSLGAGGAVLVRPGEQPVEIATPPVAPVDTVGAGDALNGALAAALADGRPLEEAARRAVAAASLSTTVPGARGGLPDRATLDATIRDQA
jgi:ribokinase